MASFISNLFNRQKVDIQEWLDKGATIVDVRSAGEFSGGHLKNSINIPLDQLKNKLSKLDKTKPVITCCASGMRSGSAKSILKSNGFEEVHNGGGWSSLREFDN
jgi:phage shock protein E